MRGPLLCAASSWPGHATFSPHSIADHLQSSRVSIHSGAHYQTPTLRQPVQVTLSPSLARQKPCRTAFVYDRFVIPCSGRSCNDTGPSVCGACVKFLSRHRPCWQHMQGNDVEDMAMRARQLTFGVVRNSKYCTLSAAKSSMTSLVMRVRIAWSVVTWWMTLNTWNTSLRVRSPAKTPLERSYKLFTFTLAQITGFSEEECTFL